MTIQSFADGRLVAEEIGHPSPGDTRVIYLHGWGRDRSDWLHIAGRVPGLIVDLPGFGSSGRPTAAMGAHGYAELISDLIDEWAGDERVVLVGHSFGGRIAIAAAADYPAKVESLLFAGTPLFRPNKSKPALGLRLIKLLNRIGIISDRRLDRERNRRGSADYRNAQGVMREVFVKVVNEDYRDELRRITQPTTLVWGIDDTAASIEHAREAAHIMAQARLIELPTGHDVHLRCPEEFATELEKLVES